MIFSEYNQTLDTCFKYVLMPMIQGFFLFAFTKTLSMKFGLACLRESTELVAGHDKELLSIMVGTDIEPKMYQHNKDDSNCINKNDTTEPSGPNSNSKDVDSNKKTKND